MDEQSLTYGMSVLEEIREALEPMGMTLEPLPAEETKGIPTGIIRMGDAPGGWEISCNVLPTHRENLSTTFVQFYLPLTPACPAQRAELERFAAACNSRFLLGTLLVFQDCLCMKYTMALEPAIVMEEAHLRTTVFAFCQQAEDIAPLGQAIGQGALTADEALAKQGA
ncbi:hypothetical protein ACTQ33_09060 [Candidatus Avoscillospira sp. LCP25S3_F1]|uniref:hypothetical protein n=1 Tax=Candidatus Avoscillospira sp. LCP25S3_F1 TaxID=3438825 RepID=UPI003F8EB3F8